MLAIFKNIYYDGPVAGVAQLVEHLIRNEGVVGSSPVTGTRIIQGGKCPLFFYLIFLFDI